MLNHELPPGDPVGQGGDLQCGLLWVGAGQHVRNTFFEFIYNITLKVLFVINVYI